jgi:hypothetical protein
MGFLLQCARKLRNRVKKREEQEERKNTKLYNNHHLKGRREETDK